MDRLILQTLQKGQTVRILTGEGDQDFRYRFTVQKVGKLPLGLLIQTDPAGMEVGPRGAELLGSGTWTTTEQNPMQRADWFIGRSYQDRALTIGWGVLYVGGCAVVRDPDDQEDNFYELQPHVTDIQITEG